MATEFDEDIQRDLDDRNSVALAFVAQDLRNIIKHVAHRSLIAALRRKTKEEAVANDRAKAALTDPETP